MTRRQQLSDRQHFVTRWMLDNFWRLVEEGRTNPGYTRRKFDQVHRMSNRVNLDISIWEYNNEQAQGVESGRA